jgi:hypothetical protein
VIAADPYIGPEALTFAIPLGVFVVGLLWLLLQRRPNR